MESGSRQNITGKHSIMLSTISSCIQITASLMQPNDMSLHTDIALGSQVVPSYYSMFVHNLELFVIELYNMQYACLLQQVYQVWMQKLGSKILSSSRFQGLEVLFSFSFAIPEIFSAEPTGVWQQPNSRPALTLCNIVLQTLIV